jgi:hypothetical protein
MARPFGGRIMRPLAELALFDGLIATGGHLAAMLIRATRLVAILLHIARDLPPTGKDDPARL